LKTTTVLHAELCNEYERKQGHEYTSAASNSILGKVQV
jgi:hypothetical protein